jgi:putative ABC transport system permease protein
MTDLRYAFRALCRAPGFAALASMTLALGIGANVAIFNVAWQVLLKPLPFPHEDQLVVIWSAYGPNRRLNPVAPANYYDWATANRSFESIAAFNLFSQESNLTGSGEPQQVRLVWVTEDFFRVLSIAPLLGRPILPSDAAGNSGNVLVLTERLWRTAFAGDRTVIGRPVIVDGDPYEIVGVMPDSAAIGTQSGDAWVRLPLRVQRGVRQAHFLSVVARMRPGVTLAQATDDVVAISERAAREFPDANAGLSARLVGFREQLAGSVRPTMMVLLGSAALVLLIACANITGLQLARQVARRREAAIRVAIGASRGRLIRSVLCEGFLLALVGGYLGLLVAVWVVATLKQLAPAMFAREIAAYPDLAVVLYTTVMAIVSGVMFAAVPAWRSGSMTVQPALQSRGSVSESGGSKLRTVLVAVEVALAVVVLAGASLLIVSLTRVLRVNPGFEFDRGLVIDLTLSGPRYAEVEARTRFFEQVIDRVQALGGVERACVMNQAPLADQRGGMTFVAEGQTRMISATPLTSSSGCPDALRISIRRGRTFARTEPEPSIILSESIAREMWPDGDAVGKRVHLGLPDGRLLTVVGVAADIRTGSLESRFVYQVWIHHEAGIFTPRQLLIRTSLDPSALAAPVRSVIRQLEPNLPVSRILTSNEVLAKSLEARRFNMLLLTGYALVALALCSVGIYGLLTQIVGQRTHEIGVRMALGAHSTDVVRHVLRDTAIGVAAGSTAGLVAAVLLSDLVRHMLFGISPRDPTLYATVVGMVMLVALAAAYTPARRATRIDPVVALRTQ